MSLVRRAEPHIAGPSEKWAVLAAAPEPVEGRAPHVGAHPLGAPLHTGCSTPVHKRGDTAGMMKHCGWSEGTAIAGRDEDETCHHSCECKQVEGEEEGAKHLLAA